MDHSKQPTPRRRPPVLARAGALTLAVGLLAACGGDDGEGSAGPAPAPTGTSVTTDAPTTTEPTTTGDTGDADATSPDAAGADATESEEAEEAQQVVITIEDFAYALPETVEPGAEIVVRNLDTVGHTVTADDGSTFDVVVGPGEEVTFAAPEEGEHPFHCTPHPAMKATLVVEGEGS